MCYSIQQENETRKYDEETCELTAAWGTCHCKDSGEVKGERHFLFLYFAILDHTWQCSGFPPGFVPRDYSWWCLGTIRSAGNGTWVDCVQIKCLTLCYLCRQEKVNKETREWFWAT